MVFPHMGGRSCCVLLIICIFYKGLLMKTTTSFSGITRRLMIIIAAGVLTTQIISAQWLSGWQYRVPISITNSGGALTDFQVQVSPGISFAWSHTRAGGADVRFTSDDGETAIDFWIESWNSGTSASLWVQVPAVAASPATTTIYMYYGNSLATSASDGYSTFEFFDDFESGEINSSRWTASGGTWTTISTVQKDGTTGYVARGVTTGYQLLNSSNFTSVTGPDYVTELDGLQISGTNWGLCTRVTAYNNFYGSIVYDHLNMLYFYDWLPGGHPSQSASIGSITTNVWYKLTARVFGNILQVSFNDDLIQNIQNSNHPLGNIALWEQDGTAYFNNVRVRKHALMEPAAVLGPEESPTPLSITYTKVDLSCFGDADGSIDITVTGGDGTYIYNWTPGNLTTEDISGLSAGVYHVFVDDEAGSIGNLDITISQPSAILPDYSIINPPACMGADATVEVTATGGTPPYSGTGVFPQPIGTTEYTITDANGCQAVIQVTVSLAESWYNSAWAYRIPIEISNPGGSELSDFQIKISLDSSVDFDKVNPGGSDIRFTTADGTPVSYWIESWDDVSEQASVWVKVPSIPISGTKLYLYYGNSLASSESNGSTTFRFFDDFEDDSPSVGIWSGYTAHDWKYSMHMQESALYYSLLRTQNGWTTESLDSEIEDEFDFMNSQINSDGTVTGLSSEPVYCYGLVLSNLALGYSYYRLSNPVLAERCYHDMERVTNYMLGQWSTPSTAPDYSIALIGFSNACKAFDLYGSTADDTVAVLQGIIEDYVDIFTQTSGNWTGQSGVQDHLKRDFGVMLAYDVIGDASYLTKVRDNIDWILANRWVSANGGLTWTSPSPGEFYECHQQWFMTAVRMLYNRDNSYDYLDEGLAAWHFLTDNNYAGIDWYVHNYDHHNAFFSYRQMLTDGSFQTATFKGSYEIGTALWGMSLNYSWVSDYQSSHSSQSYNYLDEMVRQIKKSPDETGYFSSAYNWIRQLNWSATTYQPDPALWNRVGSPVAQLVVDDGNNVLGLRGASHGDLFATVDQDFNDFIFEARIKLTQDIENACSPEVGFHYTDLSNRYFTMMRGEDLNDLFMRRIEGGTSYVDNSSSYDYTADVYIDYKIAVEDNVIRIYMDETLVTDYTDNGNLLTGGFTIGNYGNIPAYFDVVRVREFTETEPSASIGSEQSGFAWSGCVDSNWDTPGNWNAGAVPGSADDIFIFTSANYPIVTGSITCNDLVIEPLACMTVGESGSLTANSITIKSSGTSSSGSFINLGTVSSTAVTYNRFLREDDNIGDKHLLSSPVGGQDISAFIGLYADKIDILRTWDEVSASWPILTTGTFINGQGYNIYQNEGSDGDFSFTGSVVTSATVSATSPYYLDYDMRYALDPDDPFGEFNTDPLYWAGDRSWENYGGGGWNLLGNPFTSALKITDLDSDDTNDFLNVNEGSFDPSYVAVYVYNGVGGQYLYKGKSTGFIDPTEDPVNDAFGYADIQAGQGFFVLANFDEAEFSFTTAMQIHSGSVPMMKSAKTDNSWPGLQLKATSGSTESLATIFYHESMTTGIDKGYDVGKFSSGGDVDVYTMLVEKDNGVNFARQGLPVRDAEKIVIPVGVDSEAGGEVTFSAYCVPIGIDRYWLEDRTTGIFTDLTTKNYTVTIPEKTYGTGRFFIIASANTPTGIDQPSMADAGLRIWISKDKLIIKGEVSEKALCELFDLSGKKILECRLDGGDLNTIEIPARLHGVFFARVMDGLEVTTRKLVLPY